LLEEESSVTIGFSLYWPLVLPYIPMELLSLYGRVLGLGKKDVATILFGDEANFLLLISYIKIIFDPLLMYLGTPLMVNAECHLAKLH